MFTFQSLNDEIDQVPNIDISVNLIFQKLKSKHFVCLSFLWWQVFLRDWEEKYFTHIPGSSPTVCATPILVVGSKMGQFPLCNDVLLMIDIPKVNTIGHYFISNLSMLDALKKKFLIFHLDNFLIPVQYKRLLDTLRWIGILLTLTHVFVVCLG